MRRVAGIGFRTLHAALVLGAGAVPLMACQDDNKAEEAWEEMKDEAEDAKEEVEDEMDDRM
jgi:hypothetical protein